MISDWAVYRVVEELSGRWEGLAMFSDWAGFP